MALRPRGFFAAGGRFMPGRGACPRGMLHRGNCRHKRKAGGSVLFQASDSQDEPFGGCMNFASDNTAGVAPAILDAIARANNGFAPGYGNDELTRTVERRIAALFEHDAAVFLVPTGTAANALALAHVARPWGGVLCHAAAHLP